MPPSWPSCERRRTDRSLICCIALRLALSALAKYVFLDEVDPFLHSGRSVIVYHHQTRKRGGLDVQIETHARALRALNGGAEPWALVFRPFRPGVFRDPRAGASRKLAERARLFVQGVWGNGGHLELRVPDLSEVHL